MFRWKEVIENLPIGIKAEKKTYPFFTLIKNKVMTCYIFLYLFENILLNSLNLCSQLYLHHVARQRAHIRCLLNLILFFNWTHCKRTNEQVCWIWGWNWENQRSYKVSERHNNPGTDSTIYHLPINETPGLCAMILWITAQSYDNFAKMKKKAN